MAAALFCLCLSVVGRVSTFREADVVQSMRMSGVSCPFAERALEGLLLKLVNSFSMSRGVGSVFERSYKSDTLHSHSDLKIFPTMHMLVVQYRHTQLKFGENHLYEPLLY